ncbi:MAG: N-acetyltransferase [Nitrospirota bacterium]
MIRKARIQDVKKIKELINTYAEKGEMLPRPMGDIYNSLRDFTVYEENPAGKDESDGRIIGVAALHVLGWEGLAELRSVAVAPDYAGKGVGHKLVSACLKEAAELGVKEVFVLTEIEDFFRKLGFRKAVKEDLPQKVWTECRNKCVKYPDECNETALTLPLD